MVPVTRLPELALLCVFKQLPLADQMNARQVCTRWAVLVPESARRIRSLSLLVGAKSLANFDCINFHTFWHRASAYRIQRLLINEDGTPMYPTRRLTEWNSLHYKVLDDDTVDQILATFTGITKLQFAAWATDSPYEHLITILGHWRNELTTLKLYHLHNADISADLTDHLIAIINSMPALKSLTLDLGYFIDYRHLSVLNQLVDINISSNLSRRSFLESLQLHAQHNTALLRINVDVDPSDIKLLNSLDDHLCARFISLSSWHFASIALESICTRFRSLTYLTIDSPSSLRHLFTNLSLLTELTYLRLSIDFTQIEADHLEHRLLPQLLSIKAFSLQMVVSSHLELSQLHLAQTMPNVQVIYIDFDCTTCGINSFNMTKKVDHDKAKECFRQILCLLKRDCPKLCHILHDNEDILGTAEELLAK